MRVVVHAFRAELILMHALPMVLPLPGTYLREATWKAIRLEVAMGSVALHVVASAPCAVMTVRGR